MNHLMLRRYFYIIIYFEEGFQLQAVWSRFFPTYKEMMKRIQLKEIGEVVQVIVSFGQHIEHVDRAT